MEVSDKTRLFTAIDKEAINTRRILAKVWAALEEKGYEPLIRLWAT